MSASWTGPEPVPVDLILAALTAGGLLLYLIAVLIRPERF